MTSPRLVATDLDGTLLDSTGSITPRTRRALDLARAAGAEIVFVTARPPRGVDRITPQTGSDGIAVCSNGAVVYDAAAREIITSHTLDPAVAAKVAALLSEALPGVGFAVETGWNVLAEPTYDRILVVDQEYRRDLPDLDSLWDSGEPIVKLLAWSRGHSADDMLAVARAAVDGQAEITHSGGTGLLEISGAGVTKAGTLARLCAERGLTPQDVVAFGDMPNDLAVLAYAGLPYGMANAHPLVLESVRNRTLSNDEDGVAVVLERLYSN